MTVGTLAAAHTTIASYRGPPPIKLRLARGSGCHRALFFAGGHWLLRCHNPIPSFLRTKQAPLPHQNLSRDTPLCCPRPQAMAFEQQEGPAFKKLRPELQSHSELTRQVRAFRNVATCAMPGCGNIFEGRAHVCSLCQKGVCAVCHQRMVGSSAVPSNRCTFGCLLPNGRSPVALRTGGHLVELAAAVVQACAGEGCTTRGTWQELKQHRAWCVDATVGCPVCPAQVRRGDLKKHLVDGHGAAVILTTRIELVGDDSDDGSSSSDSNDEGSFCHEGEWTTNLPTNETRVACVVGSCHRSRVVQSRCNKRLCPCPFVIALARRRDHTRASVSTVFAETARPNHPMGHCEISMDATDTSDSGALVKSRCTSAGVVRAHCDGGGACGLHRARTEGRALAVRNAQPTTDDDIKKISFRFTPIAANLA